jgi:hypothetical protein
MSHFKAGPIRRLTTHARQHAVAYLALFFALGGTSAYAANTIGSADVIDGSLLSVDVKDGEVKNADLAGDAVRTAKIAAGNVTASDLAANAVNGAKVADNTLTGADVNESQLDATQLRTRVAEGDCVERDTPYDSMVKVGPVCMDRYEASIWDSPTGGNQITGPIPCNANGQNCTNIYARSVPGVKPRAEITWFQAQQALANVGKRLPTNAEWQMAVAGTPDPGSCNVSSNWVHDTAANPGCVSNHGVVDMVGNLDEWVADWDELAWARGSWGFADDQTAIGRASGEPSARRPGALSRGGSYMDGTNAGPFSVLGVHAPSVSASVLGFRGAR